MTKQQKDALYEKIRKGDDYQMARRYMRKQYDEDKKMGRPNMDTTLVKRYRGEEHNFTPIKVNKYMTTSDGKWYIRPDNARKSYPEAEYYTQRGQYLSDRWNKNVQWQKAYNSQLNAKNTERGKRYAAHIQMQGLKKIGKAAAVGAAALVALGLITHVA